MEFISPQRRVELIGRTRHLLKLELRDNYAVDARDLVAWRSGHFDEIQESYGAWRDEVAAWVTAGRTLRRVRVVSEPLSDYQQMAVRFSGTAVDAGEDLRWLPRRLVSTVLLPGNDFFVLDGKTAMFNVLDGADDRAEIQLCDEPDVVSMCLTAFDEAWTLATPHHRYRGESVAGPR